MRLLRGAPDVGQPQHNINTGRPSQGHGRPDASSSLPLRRPADDCPSVSRLVSFRLYRCPFISSILLVLFPFSIVFNFISIYSNAQTIHMDYLLHIIYH